jgi:tetratricopeptide (TPR) repeat protein
VTGSFLLGLFLVVPPQATALSYEALLAQGLAQAKEGRVEAATETFDRAIAQDPRRPEAWVERGGLAFVRRSYAEAARDLTHALALRDDAYARDLLAASLFLGGRPDDALVQWNALDRPALRALTLSGLARTRASVVRRELVPVEGSTLRLDDLRKSRLRLSELGAFRRVTFRPVPLGDGKADLEVALDERPPLGGDLAEVLADMALNLLYERARLRYYNIAGAGITLGAQYRWETHRPQWVVGFGVPRAFGTPFHLSMDAFRGRQDYDLGEALEGRAGGGGARLRAVLGSRTVLETGARVSTRTFSAPAPYAPPGRLVMLQAGLEHRLVDAWRQRLDASLRLAGASAAWGSELGFARGELRLAYRVFMTPPRGTTMEASVVAGQVVAGWGSGGTPLDEMYAPGASPDMGLPLRAHAQTSDGVLGETPLGRSLLLGNLEWRRRFVDASLVQIGFVVFSDAARVFGRPDGPPVTLVDAGVGLRLAVKGGTTLRVDYGRGLNDDSRALYVGFNQVF